MKQRIPVSTIMTANVIKVNLTDNLTKAERLFKENKIRHIPVVSGNTIIGMLSYTDLLRVSLADTIGDFEEEIDTTVYNMFSIEQVMAKKLVTIQADANIKDAVEILSKEEFRALPVMEGNLLVGILTTTDLLKYLLKQYD